VQVYTERKYKCFNIMCDADYCTGSLTSFDALIILNMDLYDAEVKHLAIKILENQKFPSDIALFLPLENTSIQEFILKQSELFEQFFWLSRINRGINADIFRNKLLLANQDKATCIQESLRLISFLEDYYNNVCQLS